VQEGGLVDGPREGIVGVPASRWQHGKLGIFRAATSTPEINVRDSTNGSRLDRGKRE
jgi:hypothetical protein